MWFILSFIYACILNFVLIFQLLGIIRDPYKTLSRPYPNIHPHYLIAIRVLHVFHLLPGVKHIFNVQATSSEEDFLILDESAPLAEVNGIDASDVVMREDKKAGIIRLVLRVKDPEFSLMPGD